MRVKRRLGSSQLQVCNAVAAAFYLLPVGLGSFFLFHTPPSGFLGDPPDLPPAPCKLVHLSVQRFNLLQFFWLPQRSRTEVCSLSCRQAPFLVAFRSGYLDLLLRQIQLMWCALGARGSNSAAAPRAPIPNFDEALPL